MRLAEQVQVRGIVLVSACHTDLGIEDEAAAGYYNRPWNWARMKANVGSFGVLQVGRWCLHRQTRHRYACMCANGLECREHVRCVGHLRYARVCHSARVCAAARAIIIMD